MDMQLESLQQVFANALGDPAQDRALVMQLKRLAPAFDQVSAAIDENRPRKPRASLAADYDDTLRERIGLYRGNVRSHWRAALANAYPVLQALVGDAYFDALSVAYVRAHPSQSGDLNRLGEALPVFIGEYEQDARFRYFADVARLEWALHIACFAADVTVFTPQQWLDLDDERLLDAQLAVHPACAAIASDYAIADVWHAHQPGGVFPQCLAARTWSLVVRPRWQPTVLAHSEAAHAAFTALQRGAPLNEALDAAYAIDREFDFVTQWRTWISASAITGVASTTWPASREIG